jgi:hypothetical protein
VDKANDVFADCVKFSVFQKFGDVAGLLPELLSLWPGSDRATAFVRDGLMVARVQRRRGRPAVADCAGSGDPRTTGRGLFDKSLLPFLIGVQSPGRSNSRTPPNVLRRFLVDEANAVFTDWVKFFRFPEMRGSSGLGSETCGRRPVRGQETRVQHGDPRTTQLCCGRSPTVPLRSTGTVSRYAQPPR